MSTKEIEEYNERGNRIYRKYLNGFECWWEYDKNNDLIYYKDSDGYEYWYKYDENKQIEITKQEFKQIERTKLYFNNKRINRFEIMDI